MSAFSLHNETFNFWSHFLPSLYFIYLLFVTTSNIRFEAIRLGFPSDTANELRTWPIYVYLVGCLCCLIGSSVYHLFDCKCKNTFEIVAKLDYSGICALGFGSVFGFAFYYFYCWFCSFLKRQ